jgi:ketosteroid isomerase-like protein
MPGGDPKSPGWGPSRSLSPQQKIRGIFTPALPGSESMVVRTWELLPMTKFLWIAVLLGCTMSCQISFAQGAPSASSEKEAIQQVISGYYDAVGRDPMEAASFYGEPAMIVLPNDVLAMNKRDDVEKFLAKLVEGLRPLGYSHSKLNDPRIKLLNNNTAIYSTIAVRYKTDGSELQRAGFTYLLRKGPSGWKIHELVATDLDKLISAD